MNFTLIHPSRGRARQAFNTMANWLNKCRKPKEVQYIFSLDSDDNQLPVYRSLIAGIKTQLQEPAKILVNPNKNLIQAIQKATQEQLRGQIIIVVSDDFDCPSGWDELIVSAIDEAAMVYGHNRLALRINDGITKPSDKILTLPILTKELFDSLGYIYHPSYTGMFADNDLYESAEKVGKVRTVSHLLFEHKHWINSKATKDATYERHNNNLSWNLGKQLLEKRRSSNFGIA